MVHGCFGFVCILDRSFLLPQTSVSVIFVFYLLHNQLCFWIVIDPSSVGKADSTVEIITSAYAILTQNWRCTTRKDHLKCFWHRLHHCTNISSRAKWSHKSGYQLVKLTRVPFIWKGWWWQQSIHRKIKLYEGVKLTMKPENNTAVWVCVWEEKYCTVVHAWAL